jgi:hypothetical protein
MDTAFTTGRAVAQFIRLAVLAAAAFTVVAEDSMAVGAAVEDPTVVAVVARMAAVVDTKSAYPQAWKRGWPSPAFFCTWHPDEHICPRITSY